VDTTLKTEISRFELINAEKLKKHERGIDEALRGQALVVEERLNEITALAGKSYSEIEAYKASCTEHFAEFDAAVEGIRKRGKELSAENEERLASVRAKIEETAVEITTRRTEMFGAISEGVKSLENAINTAEKRIDDFFSKTELIDKTIAVKKDIENELEDLNADMEKLALRSIEISELKNQFEKIKRMEEDINNKMSEFNIEQQRIERMEINFNRLLQTSQSVEERLKHISDSDDMLQEAQIKLRKLGEIIGEAEEKYQRIEKKNLILETTSDGIDKNFGLLQDSEAAVQKLGGDIQRITVGLDDIRTAITKLAEENEKAHDTIEKLSTLDKTMNDLDVRIGDMQKARAWLADLETRLNEKYREAQQLVKLSGDIIKGEKISADMENSLSSEIRDNVIRLKKLGWSVDDIVKALKVSRSAVELILEMAPREK
jgi:chromosome segregation ATPase